MFINNEKGGGLILVIVVMAVLMILATTFLTLTTSEGKQTARYHHKIQAYHYAMSGVEFAFEVLQNNFLNGNLQEGFPEESFPAYFNGGLEGGFVVGEVNTEDISVEILSDDEGLLIKSTGRVGDIDEVISVRIPKLKGEDGAGGNPGGGKKPNIPPNQGVIITNNINLKGNAQIIGNATLGGNVSTGGSSGITGGVNQGTDLNYSMPTFPTYPEGLSTPPDISPVNDGRLVVGQYPHRDYFIDEDGVYEEIKIGSNGTLTIDVGEGTRIIRVKELDLQQGHIQIQGSGQLILYVEDYLQLKGTINNLGQDNHILGNPQQLTVFYGGNTPLDLSGKDVFIGDLFCRTANISIGGGNIVGNVVTGGSSVEVGGNAEANIPLLYVPNGDVAVSGGANLKGVVVAKSLEGSGHGTIEFTDSSEVIFPELIWGSGNGGSGNSFGSPVWGN